MSAIFEFQPDITDTSEERSSLLKDAQQFALDSKEEDDFLVVASDDEQEEVIEESDSDFTIDGKHKHFKYISSLNHSGDFISFGQDDLGLWWYFIRTNLSAGKDLHGPFRNKEKMHEALMEKLNA